MTRTDQARTGSGFAPKQVRIGPFTYCLERSPIVDNASRWGQCDNNQKRLQFGIMTGRGQLPATLIHELIHAVAHVYGVPILDDYEKTDGLHDQIGVLGHGLAQVLIDLGFLPAELVFEGEDNGSYDEEQSKL